MDLTLYLVTDSIGIDDDRFFNTIEKALSAGVGVVQLREKNLSTLDFYNKAYKLKQICDRYKVPLLINDRIDIALAVDASGVHLGTSDMPIKLARELLGKDKIIGATAKTVEAAREAEADGADYFGIGAFFKTGTKTDAYVMTADDICMVNESVTIPSVGIGGLTYENMDVIKGSKVSGIAVSSAVMRADDVEKTVMAMKEKVRKLL